MKEKALKYVGENLLNNVYEENILLSLRVAEECRCPIDNDILDAVRDLLSEFADDNELGEDWVDDNFLDLEEAFFDAYDYIHFTLI